MAGWRVVVRRTDDLDATTLAAVRSLCDAAFHAHPDGGFSDDDWAHCLGGRHALVHDGEELVAHGALVRRRLLHGDRVLGAGYVEAVVVAATHRRRGAGDAVMEALERLLRESCDLGALGATEEGAALYARRGWSVWRGPTGVMTPAGIEPTPDDDGAVMVLPVVEGVDLDGGLACERRAGDVW